MGFGEELMFESSEVCTVLNFLFHRSEMGGVLYDSVLPSTSFPRGRFKRDGGGLCLMIS